jgi:hypothetical protein
VTGAPGARRSRPELTASTRGRINGVDAASFRAGDADRERVAERLRVALEEGRLNLHEYDDRLRQAYAARTYADLDALIADLPGVTPPSQSQVVPAATTADNAAATWRPNADGKYPDATRRWVVKQWDGWISVVVVCTLIWFVTSVFSGEGAYFWPIWVAGPWGALLLVQTLRGLIAGEPQRWAAKEARKEAEREVRRRAHGRDTDAEPDDADG